MKRTDWDAYYSRPYKTATITRKITTRHLARILLDIQRQSPKNLEIIELGGANSCFYESILGALKPASYSILDNNTLGLQKFRERIGSHPGEIIHADVLNAEVDRKYDVAFSVGLIEHFSPTDTLRAVHTHLNLVKPGGYLVLFFPTPTWLYRLTRKLSELLRLWIFHDERPLFPDEITSILPNDSRLKISYTIWPIFLTQAVLVIQKAADEVPA
jgi:hypothetical protein